MYLFYFSFNLKKICIFSARFTSAPSNDCFCHLKYYFLFFLFLSGTRRKDPINRPPKEIPRTPRFRIAYKTGIWSKCWLFLSKRKIYYIHITYIKAIYVIKLITWFKLKLFKLRDRISLYLYTFKHQYCNE
jgi:hypothetical protein